MLKINRKNGFTLIEIMVASMILFVVVTAVFSIFTMGMSVWQMSNATADNQYSTRMAMQKIIQELRMSKLSAVKIYDAGARIHFQIPVYINRQIQLQSNGNPQWGDGINNGNWICYKLVNASGNNQQLLRMVISNDSDSSENPPLSQTTLANNIQNINFTGLPTNSSAVFLEITINGQKTINQRLVGTALRSRVMLRN